MKKKLRVLVCLGGYNPEIAGGAIQQENIINNLKNKINFNVISFSKLFDDRVSLSIKKVYRIKKYNNILILKSIFKLIVYFFAIRNSFDVLHLRGGTKRILILIIMGILLKKKIIYTPTRYLEDDLNTLRINNKFMYYLLLKVDLIHCISPIFFKSKNKFITKKFNYKYIPNLVDTNKFKKEDKVENKIPKIICVGFFSKIKNQLLLYKAWLNILQIKNCHLIFVGKKKFDYYLSKKDIYKNIFNDAKNRNILNKLKFIDHDRDMKKHYNHSDIFVLPSTTEGMPNSLLEAMSCSLPCVVTNLKFITTPIIINGKNGYLFKRNNKKDLENCLIKLIKSKKLRKKMGKTAKKYVENNFSFKKNYFKYEKMYHDIYAIDK